MALAETARLLASYDFQNKGSANINQAIGQLGKLEAKSNSLSSSMDRIGKGAGQVGAGLLRLGTVAVVGVGTAFAGTLKAAGDFEAQLNTINTIAFVSKDRLSQLGAGILKTSRDTGAGLSDLTAAYYDLLSAGVKVTDAQKELDVAVRLSIGGLSTTAEAVDLLTTAQNSYGLSAEGTAHAADVFAKAVEDGKLKVSEIAGTFADVAPIAKTVGVSIEELGAAYASLTAKGVPAAEVATEANRAILELIKPNSDMAAILKDLNISGQQLIKREGLVGALETVREEAGKQGVTFQSLFGRIEGYKFALNTTGPALAGFNEELKRMGQSAGEAQHQFEERQQGLNFQLGRLKANVLSAAITIGDKLLPVIVPLVAQLNDFISKNSNKISSFGKQLAESIRGFVGEVSGGKFNGVIEGFKALANISKTVLDIFLRLPGPVQAIAVAAIGLSRIPGGALLEKGIANVLVGSGGLLTGLIGKLVGNKAVPQNVFATQPIPVFVVGMAPGLGLPGTGGGLPVAPAAGAGEGLLAGFLASGALPLAALATVAAGVAALLILRPGTRDKVAGFDDTTGQRRGGFDRSAGLSGQQLRGPTGSASDPLHVTIPTSTPVGAGLANLAHGYGQVAGKTGAGGLVQTKPAQPPISAAEFERILKTTPFIGTAQYKSIFEQFTTFKGGGRGKDPVGEGFLALVQRLKDPKAPAVMFEINGHLRELRALEAYYIAHGDTANALKVQGVIDKVDQLIGVTEKNHPATLAAQKATQAAIVRNAAINDEGSRRVANILGTVRQATVGAQTAISAGAQRTATHLSRLEGLNSATATNTGITARKKELISVTVPITTYASFSVNALGNQLTHIDETVSQQYGGKVVPLG